MCSREAASRDHRRRATTRRVTTIPPRPEGGTTNPIRLEPRRVGPLASRLAAEVGPQAMETMTQLTATPQMTALSGRLRAAASPTALTTS